MNQDLLRLLTFLANLLPDISEETQGRVAFWAIMLMLVQALAFTLAGLAGLR